MLAKIGVGHGREWFLTGERFDADVARQIGLVNYVVADEETLDAKVTSLVNGLLRGAPGAQTAAKGLVRTVAYQSKEAMRRYTATVIAERRASDEGREGMAAFSQKRDPNWE